MFGMRSPAHRIYFLSENTFLEPVHFSLAHVNPFMCIFLVPNLMTPLYVSNAARCRIPHFILNIVK